MKVFREQPETGVYTSGGHIHVTQTDFEGVPNHIYFSPDFLQKIIDELTLQLTLLKAEESAKDAAFKKE